MSIPAELGRVVMSTAGRDAGKYFLIVGIESDKVIYIADGVIRKLEKPKRKKIKHVVLKPQIAQAIGEKLKEGKKVFDPEIKSALMSFENECQAK